MKEIAFYGKKDGVRFLKGHFMIDDEDFEEVSKHNWICSNGYVQNGKLGRLSRWLLGTTEQGIYVDHIDHNPLNNCRSNLREATPSLNAHNRKKNSKHKNTYAGVVWNKRQQKWEVKLGKTSFGKYEDELHAARVYNWAATEKYGNDANLNDVPEDPNFKPPDIKRRLPVEERGIYQYKTKWGVRLKVNGTKIFLGYHHTREEALNVMRKWRQEQLDKMEEEHLKKNITRNKDGIAIIPVKLKGGKETTYAMVDDNWWHTLIKNSWSSSNGASDGYPTNGVVMHQYLMKAPQGKVIDHINRNKMDNRLCNLRITSYKGNSQNRSSTSKRDLPRGVSKVDSKFLTMISGMRIGKYPTSEEAAHAYDRKAIELYGVNAYTNYPASDYLDDKGDLKIVDIQPETTITPKTKSKTSTTDTNVNASTV